MQWPLLYAIRLICVPLKWREMAIIVTVSVHPSTNSGHIGVIPCSNRLNDTATVSDWTWLIKTQLDLVRVE